jgi:hypothetical protein
VLPTVVKWQTPIRLGRQLGVPKLKSGRRHIEGQLKDTTCVHDRLPLLWSSVQSFGQCTEGVLRRRCPHGGAQRPAAFEELVGSRKRARGTRRSPLGAHPKEGRRVQSPLTDSCYWNSDGSNGTVATQNEKGSRGEARRCSSRAGSIALSDFSRLRPRESRIREPFRRISVTKTFSTPYATPSWRRHGSRIFGETNWSAPLAVDILRNWN